MKRFWLLVVLKIRSEHSREHLEPKWRKTIVDRACERVVLERHHVVLEKVLALLVQIIAYLTYYNNSDC